jgi:hypothetical protein
LSEYYLSLCLLTVKGEGRKLPFVHAEVLTRRLMFMERGFWVKDRKKLIRKPTLHTTISL